MPLTAPALLAWDLITRLSGLVALELLSFKPLTAPLIFSGVWMLDYYFFATSPWPFHHTLLPVLIFFPAYRLHFPIFCFTLSSRYFLWLWVALLMFGLATVNSYLAYEVNAPPLLPRPNAESGTVRTTVQFSTLPLRP